MSNSAVATKLVSDHQLQPLDPDGPKWRGSSTLGCGAWVGVGKRLGK